MSTDSKWRPSDGVIDDDVLAAIDSYLGKDGLSAQDWLVADIYTSAADHDDIVARCVIGRRTFYVAGECDAELTDNGWKSSYTWCVTEVR